MEIHVGFTPPNLPPTVTQSGVSDSNPSSVATIGNVLSTFKNEAMNYSGGDLPTLQSYIKAAVQTLSNMNLAGKCPNEAMIEGQFSHPTHDNNDLGEQIEGCHGLFEGNSSLYKPNQSTSDLVRGVLEANTGSSSLGAVVLSQAILKGPAHPDSHTPFLQEALGVCPGSLAPALAQSLKEGTFNDQQDLDVLPSITKFESSLGPQSDQFFLALLKGVPLCTFAKGSGLSDIESLVSEVGEGGAKTATALLSGMNFPQLTPTDVSNLKLLSSFSEKSVGGEQNPFISQLFNSLSINQISQYTGALVTIMSVVDSSPIPSASFYPILEALTGGMNIAELCNSTSDPSMLASHLDQIITTLNNVNAKAPLNNINITSFISELFTSSTNIATLSAQNTTDLCSLISFYGGLDYSDIEIVNKLLSGVNITQMAGKVNALENMINEMSVRDPDTAQEVITLIGNLTFPELTSDDANNLVQLANLYNAPITNDQLLLFMQLAQGMNIQQLGPYVGYLQDMLTASNSAIFSGADSFYKILTGGMNIAQLYSATSDPSALASNFAEILTALNKANTQMPLSDEPPIGAFISGLLCSSKSIAALNNQNVTDLGNLISFYSGLDNYDFINITNVLLKGVDITQLEGNINALENLVNGINLSDPDAAQVAITWIGNLTFPELSSNDANNLILLINLFDGTPLNDQATFLLQLTQGMNIQQLGPYVADINNLMGIVDNYSFEGVGSFLQVLTDNLDIQDFMSNSADFSQTLNGMDAVLKAVQNYNSTHSSAPMTAVDLLSLLDVEGKIFAQLNQTECANLVEEITDFTGG